MPTILREEPATPCAILILAASVLHLRFYRETLTGFLNCTVDTTPSAEYAFELAIRKPYNLFLFELNSAVITGQVLYGLLRKVYDEAATGPKQLPPIIFLADEINTHTSVTAEIGRQPGVRGILKSPPAIQRLIEKVSGCVDSRHLKPVARGIRST